MRSVADIGQRLESAISDNSVSVGADELLELGEQILEHWVLAHEKEPTGELREGFRLLALHRQGAQGDASFNACRETCRELVYHYNLVTMQSEHPDRAQHLMMMTLVANHLFLFISGKLETQQLGEFCCSSKPLHAEN